MTSFRDACKPYFNFSPIMSNKPYAEPDGNGPGYLGHYFSILKERGELDLKIDREHFLKVIDLIQVKPGVYNRSDTKKEHEAHDNLVSISRCAQILAPEIAQDIYAHGLAHDWVYNNTGSRNALTVLKSWHWRLPGVVQHYKLCADTPPITPFDEWYFALDKISTGFKPWSATSGRLMDWIKIKAYLDAAHKSERLDKIVEAFVLNIENKYPKKMGGVYGKFFATTHPFAVYMDGKI